MSTGLCTLVTLLPKMALCLLWIFFFLANQKLVPNFLTSVQQLIFSFTDLIYMLVLGSVNQHCQFHSSSVWITTSPGCSLLLKQDLWLRIQFRVFIPNLTPFSFLRNHFLPTVLISLKCSLGFSGHQTNLNLIVSWNRAALLRKHWQKPCLWY